jgi:hypothetical protein
MKQSKKKNTLGFSNHSEMMTLLEMRNLISKALSFYCGKYKKRFNYNELTPSLEEADILFKYDNREYQVTLKIKSPEGYSETAVNLYTRSDSATDQVDEMIKESDWNNDELVSSAINKVKKTIN